MLLYSFTILFSAVVSLGIAWFFWKKKDGELRSAIVQLFFSLGLQYLFFGIVVLIEHFTGTHLILRSVIGSVLLIFVLFSLLRFAFYINFHHGTDSA